MHRTKGLVPLLLIVMLSASAAGYTAPAEAAMGRSRVIREESAPAPEPLPPPAHRDEAPEPKTLFLPLDIPLDPALQEFAVREAENTGLDPGILFAIMEHESRYNVDAVGVNPNGSTDVGLCQINSVNWAWLAAEGIDVHTPEGNIQACLRILALHLEDHSLDQSLAAYACGEGGMRRGQGFWFAQRILEAAEKQAASDPGR